jgi:4'-phosphopantetheinyl transferase
MADLLTLDNQHVDVWLVRPLEIQSSELLSRYRQLLTEQERERVERFRFEKDRHRALITRALVRTVLSRYIDVDPMQWRFGENEHGRPFITNAVPGVDALSFNLSHTTGLIVLAVSHRRIVGIDTEYLERKNATADIANRFFAPAEVAELVQLPEPEQREHFFQYWTLKESYIKARGMGLALPLDGFAFALQTEGRIGFSVQPELNDRAEQWRFWLFKESPQHFIALCVERDLQVPQIVMRDAVPLVSEALTSYPLARESMA